MAERAGFEPAVGISPHTLSRRATLAGGPARGRRPAGGARQHARGGAGVRVTGSAATTRLAQDGRRQPGGMSEIACYNRRLRGEVDEWFKSHAWKACVG